MSGSFIGLRCAALAIAVAATVLPSLASGRLPPVVMPELTFASFADCVAELRTRHDEALRSVDPAPLPVENGTLQHLLDSAGVVEDSATLAHLDLRFSTQAKSPMPETRQYRFSNSYDERSLVCTGPVLSEQSVQGYTLDSFAPMP